MKFFVLEQYGNEHYGVRTGFPTSDIDYLLLENLSDKDRVGLEIALLGFYIPVVDSKGKIIFTPKDYDELRSKMQGLSYYDENDYKLSKELISGDIEEIARKIEENNKETSIKRNKINNRILKVLEEYGLKLKNEIDGDLSEGTIELIDIGSTGRGTNIPGKGDFDLMMKVDRKLKMNDSIFSEIKSKITESFGKIDTPKTTGNGDFRYKGVNLDDNTKLDIDITFSQKTDKILYSTDMAVRDRLNTIKKQHPEEYKYVIANILKAKEILNEAGVYKSYNSDPESGGLGGIGIENWILQNGGSLIEASNSFIENSKEKNFYEFKNSYYIWNFGENHMAANKDGMLNSKDLHNNFVDGMDERGYEKMKVVLKNYIKDHSKSVQKLGQETFPELLDVELISQIENFEKNNDKNKVNINKDI